MLEYSQYKNQYESALTKEGMSPTDRQDWMENSGGLEFYIARQETKRALPAVILGLLAARTTEIVYSAVYNELSTRGGDTSALTTYVPAIGMGLPTALIAGIFFAIAAKPTCNALKNYAIFAMKDIASSDPPKDEDGNPLSTF